MVLRFWFRFVWNCVSHSNLTFLFCNITYDNCMSTVAFFPVPCESVVSRLYRCLIIILNSVSTVVLRRNHVLLMLIDAKRYVEITRLCWWLPSLWQHHWHYATLLQGAFCTVLLFVNLHWALTVSELWCVAVSAPDRHWNELVVCSLCCWYISNNIFILSDFVAVMSVVLLFSSSFCRCI